MKEIKKMGGCNAYRVQLEEEKALLLNQIDSNYVKNSKSKKWCILFNNDDMFCEAFNLDLKC